MKHNSIAALVAAFAVFAFAQSVKAQNFEEFVKQQNAEFEEFAKERQQGIEALKAEYEQTVEDYKRAMNRMYDSEISSIDLMSSDDNIEVIHDADLVIIPDKKFFALFNVVYEPGETVPLDIREVVDTATFDLGPSVANLVKGFSFRDEYNDVLIEFTDSENFVTYVDAENRETYYSYGTYNIYMGDEAVEQVSLLNDYGLTRQDQLEVMPNMLAKYSDIGKDPQAETVDEEDYVAIIFDIKGFVDEEGNEDKDEFKEFTALYLGFYIEEYDALDLINMNTINYYYLVKEEGGE